MVMTFQQKRNVRQRARKRVQIETQIVTCAAAAFQRHGYHGVSVEQIAAELKMTKGNLYNYFKSKEDILYACHVHALDVLLQYLNEVKKNNLPPDGKLRLLIGGAVHLFMDEMQDMWTLELDALPAPLLKRVIAKRDRVERVFRDVLKEGMRDRMFAPGNPKFLTFAILGAVNWIPRWYNPAGHATSDEIAEVFADCLVNGILTRTR